MKKFAPFLFLLIIAAFNTISTSAQDDILWGDRLPENWTGTWPDNMRTSCEKSGFTTTADTRDIQDFFVMLQMNSGNVSFFDMFTSDLGRNCPVAVLADPVINSAREAKMSGKTIIYLQGGIHPSESEGKEALLMLCRDILFGQKKYLLDSLIIMVCPNFNIDGNETRTIARSIPILSGTRENAKKYDVNRDAIKVETTNMQGAYTRLFNTWDPIIIYDTHRMGNVRHGYPIVYAGSNVATATQGPRDYVTYKIFPELTKGARKDGRIEVFYHCGISRGWPPAEFTHDNAIWSTEAKFMVSGYGLRNRMGILVETAGYNSYEKMVYVQYALADEFLKYCYNHGSEMKEECDKADREVVENIEKNASSGKLMNWVEGKYVSEGKFDILGYKEIPYENIPGTGLRRADPEVIARPPEVIHNVDLITKPVGTKEAMVPAGYIIPADLGFIAEKLRILGLKVEELKEPVIASGDQFVISALTHERSAGYNMSRLEGEFKRINSREFPAGSFILDMKQPLANVAFYALEPEVGDGFLGWNLLDEYLTDEGVGDKPVVYPFFKYLILKNK